MISVKYNIWDFNRDGTVLQPFFIEIEGCYLNAINGVRQDYGPLHFEKTIYYAWKDLQKGMANKIAISYNKSGYITRTKENIFYFQYCKMYMISIIDPWTTIRDFKPPYFIAYDSTQK